MHSMHNAAPHSHPPQLPTWLRVLLWIVVFAAMALVFGLYLQPDFMLTMADQVWACF